MARRLLALLLLAARAAAEEPDCTCTCLHSSCGLSFVGAVEPLPPDSLNIVPCVDPRDCESAPQYVEGPYYQGCWTVADGFPREDLPVSLCAEEQPRRRLRFSNYVDDPCFLVYNIRFWTNDVSLDVVGEDEANDIFTCATADLAGVSPEQVVVTEITPSVGECEIAVRGEAQAQAVQRRLSGAPPPPPPDLPPGLPPPPGPPVGGKTKADATAAIKACAEKKKAMPVWQSASVDPFIGGKPPSPSLVKRERAIPADVQGCCCGSTRVPDDDPFPGPVPLP